MGETMTSKLDPHANVTVGGGGGRSLIVFCDFDGTFSLQDVGSTIAKRHIPDRRKELWGRYESGELTAWQYTFELLDGLELPREELDAFLRTIELDPGSRGLLAWCREQGVPFRILSDGFNRNLEALQRMNRVEFFYYSNRLYYEGDRWCISPGYPNEACGCGTGTCKGTLISNYRVENPGAFCVHIGNGRVSDLCGAKASDLTFARRGETDTLGPAMEERGLPFEWFDTLADVQRALEALVARSASEPA
jgi:2-hydroxy-3-keto-5-methylthiopentenyl-1-phosphate phosphatase